MTPHPLSNPVVPSSPDVKRRDADSETHPMDLALDTGLPAPMNGMGTDAAALSANLALCVVEIIAGVRALEQIGRWVTDAVYMHILRRKVIASRYRAVAGMEERRPRIRVGRPVVSYLGDHAAEAVVMIHQPTRSRAVAIRLEWHRSRWRAVAIHVI